MNFSTCFRYKKKPKPATELVGGPYIPERALSKLERCAARTLKRVSRRTSAEDFLQASLLHLKNPLLRENESELVETGGGGEI